MVLNDLYVIADFIKRNFSQEEKDFNIQISMNKNELTALDEEMYQATANSTTFTHTPIVKATINDIDFTLMEK